MIVYEIIKPKLSEKGILLRSFTNLRGTTVALLSFLAYAISTITVVGLKENQTNQQLQDVLLAS